MKYITLQVTPYQEKNGIITAFNEEGVITFKVPGLLSNKNQFYMLNTPLSLIEPTFSPSKRGNSHILKEVEILFSPLSKQMDEKYLNTINALLEISRKLVDNEEKQIIFNDLLNSLISLKQNNEPYLVLLKYVLRVINLTGYGFQVNHCLRCNQKKDIVAFSFIEGGFICRNCFNEDDHNDLSLVEMKLFRNIYLKDNYDFTSFDYQEKVVVNLLNGLAHFIGDAYGYSINSLLIK